jgi:hypothetical protein
VTFPSGCLVAGIIERWGRLTPLSFDRSTGAKDLR